MSAREWNVYTDGSCKAGPEQQRPGGWGYYAKPPRTDIVPLEGYGGEPDTHAKIMEYRAIAEALSALPEGARAGEDERRGRHAGIGGRARRGGGRARARGGRRFACGGEIF
jgi:hypothetical protein